MRAVTSFLKTAGVAGFITCFGHFRQLVCRDVQHILLFR